MIHHLRRSAPLGIFLFTILFIGLLSSSTRAAPGDVLLVVENELLDPDGVAVDTSGNIYITDYQRDQIKVYDNTGTFQFKFGPQYAGGVLNGPADIAVDVDGLVYVVFYATSKVQVYNTSGVFQFEFGSNGTGDGQFLTPRSIAVDDSGNIYVVDDGRYDVQVFDPSGNFLGKFGGQGSGDGLFQGPVGIAVNGTGTLIYVSDFSESNIEVFDNTGTWQFTIGANGSADGEFLGPWGIAVDSSNNLYVVDNNRDDVQIFDSGGGYAAKFGSNGTGNGQFLFPESIAVDSSGNIYISDWDRDDMQKFDSNFIFQSRIGQGTYEDGQFVSAADIDVDGSGNIHVLDFMAPNVQIFDPSGNFSLKFGAAGSLDGQFQFPQAMAVTSSGNTYVVDSGRDDIQVFNSSGTFITKFGTSGSGDGQLLTPTDIFVDSVGNTYVVDSQRDDVQVFDSDGLFVRKFGSTGTGNGQFDFPNGIVVDSMGNIYVLDGVRADVQVFNSSGTFLFKFGSYGSLDGQFIAPVDIAMDSNRNVYVVDNSGVQNVVQVFGPGGNFRAKFGSTGFGSGQFYGPTGVALDSSDNIYVSDAPHHGFQVFETLALGAAPPTPTPTATTFMSPTPTLTPSATPTNTPTSTPVPDTSVSNLSVYDDTDGGAVLPTFTFTLAVDGSGNLIPVEWFNLVLTGADGTILLDIWLPYDLYCEGIICTIPLTEDWFPAGLLSSDYSWKVRTWDASTGITEFSTDSGFTVDVEAPGVPANVGVSTSDGRIVISFDYDPTAAWYHVVIKDANGNVVYDAWHSIDEVTCDETRCSFVLPELPGLVDAEGGTPGLVNGSYSLEISAWGPGGFNGSDSGSATVQTFSVSVGEAGVAGIPADYAITNTNSGSPTFRWIPAENATYQLLWIGTPTGLPDALTSTPILTYHIRWYPVDDMECLEGQGNPCLFTPQDVFLANGAYEYWVLSWGPAGASKAGSFLGWTQGPVFTVAADEPTPATPLTPTGTLTKGKTNYTWQHVPGVTWYNVWVGTLDNGQYTTAYQNWHRATEIGCLETGTCVIDPDELYLPEDDYVWYIQSYNPAWNPANVVNYWSNPPGSFNVNRP